TVPGNAALGDFPEIPERRRRRGVDHHAMTPDPIARRNAGLRRISAITKGAVVGGLILTGGISALAARSFSGTSTAATQTVTQPTTQSTTATTAQATTNTTVQQTLQSPSYSVRTSKG